jgi:serine/threonine protein kinase
MNAASLWEDLVYEAALKVEDSAARKVFLDQACVGDPGLRAAVEEMLSTRAEAERFFTESSLALRVSAEAVQSGNGGPALAGDSRVKLPEDEEIGTRIGHYKLLNRIGEGGCGSVYLAEQEEPVRRKVALKIIKLGMDTKSLVARFGAERQALALMDHPNIARALDMGATESGRPYFVMELVRGEKITDYCDRQKLDIRRRLALFIQICHAVQHAHHKGIIHRDLKPSNILVTSDDGAPAPKVIDFGIAKAITGERLADNTVFTACEQFIGTPAYMSPEQAQMERMDIDTRSDIYSLGVLLYELLTGHTPFDGNELIKSGMEELRRTLREKEPPRPSAMLASLPPGDLAAAAQLRGTGQDRLVGLVRGDLDWIVMKALEKDRARRYETAHEMVLDIERYLNGEAVLASPPGRMYLLRKLVRRNKAMFAAAAAVLAALCLGLGISTWFYFQERVARQDAETEKNFGAALLAKVEAGQNIARAAVDWDAGRFPDAAALVLKIAPDSLYPSLQAAEVYRNILAWYATREQWQDAAKLLGGLLHVDQYRNYNSPAAVWDLLEAGATMIEAGNPQAAAQYEQLRQEAIRRSAGTGDPLAAERLIRTSLLLPASPETMRSLDLPAQTVEKSLSGNDPDANSISGEAPWRWVALALMDYRRGNWNEAAQRCQSLPSADTNPARIAATRLILAMSWQNLGKSSEAAAAFKQGCELIEAKFHTGLASERESEGYWFDWATVQILQREAAGLVKSAP